MIPETVVTDTYRPVVASEEIIEGGRVTGWSGRLQILPISTCFMPARLDLRQKLSALFAATHGRGKQPPMGDGVLRLYGF